MKHSITYIIVFLFLSMAFAQGDNAVQPKDSVLLHLEQQYKIATSDTTKINTLVKLAQYHAFRETEKALPLLDEALSLLNASEEKNESIMMGEIFRLYGVANRRLGNFQNALAYNQKAYDIYVKVKDSISMAMMNHNIAVMYRNIKQYRKSIEFGKKAIAINKKIDNQDGLGFYHNNIAKAFLSLKDEDSAIWYFKKAKDYFEEANYQGGILKVNASHAKILVERKKYREALAIFLKNLEYIEPGNLKQDIIEESLKISDVYLKLKNYKNSLAYAEKALNIAKKENFIRQIAAAYELKAQVLILANRYQDAYNNIILHQQYEDSISNHTNVGKVKEIELSYAYKKEKLKDSLQRVKEVELAEANFNLLKAESKLQRQWFILGFIGLLAFFTILYLLRLKHFANRKKELQEGFSKDLIEEQEKERSRLARELHDSVGQKLMLLSKTTKNLGNENAEKLASSTLEEVRNISRGLHPSNLERLGLTTAINALIYDINVNTDLFFTEEIDNIDNILSKESELHLYRIIQESLSNIVKHSEAKAVKLDIQKENKKVIISIDDNGKGFDITSKKKSQSLGLKTLFERARIIDALIDLQSNIGKGTKLTISIPIHHG